MTNWRELRQNFLIKGYVLFWCLAPMALVVLLGLIAWHVDRAVRHFDATDTQWRTDVSRNLVVIGGAARDLELTLRDEHKAEGAQLATAAAAAAALQASAKSIASFVDSVNAALTGPKGTLPALSNLIRHQDDNLAALEGQATADLAKLATSETELAAVLANASKASASAAELAANPDILKALAQLNAALDETNSTLAHVDAIAASGDRDAQMIEARLRDALKPASLAKSLFMRALGVAGPAAQVATAAK